MRILSTIFLILLTAFLSIWFVSDLYSKGWVDFTESQEALQEGSQLFDVDKIRFHEISISGPSGKELRFQQTLDGYWVCLSPYIDRADYTHINSIIEFTLKAQVVDSAPLEEIEPKDYGFDDNSYKISYISKEGESILSYRIGIPSEWHKRVISRNKQMQQTIDDYPTVFVIKENAPDDQILYLVKDPKSGIRKQFRNDFEGFRDHKPFALNSKFIEKVTIRRANSEIVIDRSTQTSLWRISKPLDLSTDTKANAKFLTGLSQLSAIKIHQIEDVTLPQEFKDLTEVSVKNFNIDKETTLTIYPSPKGSNTAYATVDDRPGIVFELPLTPPKDPNSQQASLSILPQTINEIRARNMLNLGKMSNIRGFIIRHAQKTPIAISRKYGKEFELLTKDKNAATNINLIHLKNLISALTVYPVKDFVSDAASDLSLYNFQNPILSVSVLPFSGRTQRIVFALKDGKIYAYKQIRTINQDWLNSSVVWELAPEAYQLITTNEYEWKENKLWDLTVDDVTRFKLTYPSSQNSPSLTVHYDYIGDSFTGTYTEQGAEPKNVTEKIDPVQAKYFLNNTCYISASNRLGPDNVNAKKALENPALTVTFHTTKYDNEGLPTSETMINTISFAKPTPNTVNPAFYYAKTNKDDDYLIVSKQLFRKFTTNIFGDQ